MDKFNCILFGESGVGKTPFAGTLQEFPPTSPCLHLDVDKGAMSLDTLKIKPTVLPVDRWNMMAVIYDKIQKEDWEGLGEYISRNSKQSVEPQKYKSLVIDSGTELEYRLRRGVVEANDKGDMEIPSQPDYLRTQERFRKMYRMFRDLPISVVMTAGIREVKEESTGIIKRSPDFQPSLVHDLVRMSDFVIYMDVKSSGTGTDTKFEKHLVTSLSQRFIARDRSGRLPSVITGEKFYFGKIMEKVFNA